MTFIDVVVGKVWFAVKGCVAIVAFVCGILVAVGMEWKLDSSIAQIVLGCLIILASIFVMMDFGGLKKALDRIHEETSRLHGENETLSNSLDQQRKQLAQSDAQIVKRNNQLQQSSTQITELKGQLEKSSAQIMERNKQLADSKEQLEALSKNVFDLNMTLSESRGNLDRLEGALAKQKIIQDNANKLIQSLMSAGDDFKDFKNVIQESLDRIDNTADMLDVLATRMTGAKFTEIDANGDGTVTESELSAWIRKQGHM
jgi:archaellum component FlaC